MPKEVSPVEAAREWPISRETADHRDRRIAALSGAGIPLSEVARVTGTTDRSVQYVMREKIERNVDGLGDIYREFKREMMPTIHRLVAKTLYKLDKRLDSNRLDAKELIAVLKEVAPMAGLLDTSDGDTLKTTAIARLDLSKPENIRALKEAASLERSKSEEAKKTEPSGG